MIWLLSNIWWLVPVAVALLALANPTALAILRRVPVRVWLAIAAVALLGLSFQCGRWYERSQVAEKDAAADLKAGDVVKDSKARVEKTREAITEETNDAVAEVEAEMAALPDTCPALPDSVQRSVQRQVEAARARVPKPTRGRHP